MAYLLIAGLLLAGAASDPDGPPLRQVAPGAWVLEGHSGNVLIVPGDRGTLIVDAERPGDAPEIVAAVAKLGKAPVTTVIDTHWHMDHAGGNEALAKQGATVIAQRKVRVRRSVSQYMPAYKVTVPAGSAAALPTIVYDERYQVKLGGETVSLRHAPAAHTDGDTIVWLKRADVVHMGDVYFAGIWPFIDRASGGSIDGMIAAVGTVLDRADRKTVVVPAHGPIGDKAALAKYRAMLAAVRAAVAKGIAAGQGADQIVASKPAAAWREGMEGDEDRFVAAVYDSLKPG
ncbi:MBL fold metallo-hydrolase [Sphingomonas sp. KR3-1]|uniref:MBL fold metallo-hydrolase n=1 Tax=Sphingomonas sp. KR3-1 TaxID=3156611 RepID=UPI0032B3CE9D